MRSSPRPARFTAGIATAFSLRTRSATALLRALLAIAATVVVAIDPTPAATRAVTAPPTSPALAEARRGREAAAPSSTEPGYLLRVQNVEGLLLVEATLTGGGRDTTGWLVLDTGAGYLALDHGASAHLGVVDSADQFQTLELADRPLDRLDLGALQMHQVGPVLVFDAEVVRGVTDRPVLGLLGERTLRGFAARLDYAAGAFRLIPVPPGIEVSATEPAERIRRSRAALGEGLPAGAIAVPYVRSDEGKMLVHGHVSDPSPPRRSKPLRLVVDTGATKSVMFARRLAEAAPGHQRWRSLRGLSAPTLTGDEPAWLARVPMVSVQAEGAEARSHQVDVAVLEGDLGAALEQETGERIDGLIGYSFLRRYITTIDFEQRILWLEPVPHGYEDRPNEYSHIGVQIERRDGALRITGIATGSPADRAGIQRGDAIVSIDGRDVATRDLIEVTRMLEGRPGSRVRVRVRRGSSERAYDLVRRRLL